MPIISSLGALAVNKVLYYPFPTGNAFIATRYASYDEGLPGLDIHLDTNEITYIGFTTDDVPTRGTAAVFDSDGSNLLAPSSYHSSPIAVIYKQIVSDNTNFFAAGGTSYNYSGSNYTLKPYLTKYDNTGTVQFEYMYRDSTNVNNGSYFYGIKFNNSNEFVTILQYPTNNSVRFYPVIMKLNSGGQILWDIGISQVSQSNVTVLNFDIDASDNIYILLKNVLESPVSTSYELMKINTSGTILWTKLLQNITPSSVCIYGSNILIGGIGSSSNAIICKIDNAGNLVDETSFTVGNIISTRIHTDGTGDIYFSCEYGSPATNLSITKLDSSYNILFSRLFRITLKNNFTNFQSILTTGIKYQNNKYWIGLFGTGPGVVENMWILNMPSDGTIPQIGRYFIDNTIVYMSRITYNSTTSNVTLGTGNLTSFSVIFGRFSITRTAGITTGFVDLPL